jgi:drug/metabolite transporter (DMT)-like permease
VPASLAATSFYLIPIFGVAAGAVFLGDRLEAVQWVGVLTVAVAVGLIVSRPVNAPVTAPEPEVAAQA